MRNSLIFSNTLNCVRLHTAVSDRLNDLAIADFFLFRYNQELDTTPFADIQRLPGAHCLKWVGGSLRIKRYWTMPTDDRIKYKRSIEYVENFRELFRTSIGDRLRTDRIGVTMSGGKDSTAVTATAVELLRKQSAPFDLRAFTAVYDKLIPDQERYYSGLMAKELGIPIHYLVADEYTLNEYYDQSELQLPEPVRSPKAVIGVDLYRLCAAHGRVALTGIGGDPVLYATQVVDLAKYMPIGQLAMTIMSYMLRHRQIPPLGIRSRLKKWLNKNDGIPHYPNWLNKEFENRLNLQSRWNKYYYQQNKHDHFSRPVAYEIVN